MKKFGELQGRLAPGNRATSCQYRIKRKRFFEFINLVETIMNVIKLTYCRLFIMFYTAFSVMSGRLSIFSLHSTAKSGIKHQIHQSLSNHESIFWEPFLQTYQNVSQRLEFCALFVQKKRCKGSRRVTTHWAKKQIWTLLNISGPRWLIRTCGVK